MSQDLFNHTLLGSGDVFRVFAKMVAEQVRSSFVSEVEEYIVVVVDQAQDEFMDRLRNRPWTLLPFPGNAADFQDISTTELTNSIEVVKMPREQDHDLDSVQANQVLSELVSRTDDRDIIVRRLTEKLERFQGDHPNDAAVMSLPRAVGCGLVTGSAIDFIRKVISSASRRFLRSCFRSPQDGRRVSREVHEWNYVRGESAQWQQMLDAVFAFSERNGTDLGGDVDVPNDVASYTYGNFVDLEQCRKAVAKIRRVRRLVRAANVRSILALVQQDPEQLIQQLVEGIDFTSCVTELIEVMGQDL